MKFLLWFIFIVVVVAVIGIATCPGREEHVEKVASLVTEAITDKTEDLGVVGKAINGVSKTDLVTKAVDEMLEVEEYGAFTLGKVEYRDEDYVVSLGIFGTVLTISADMLGDGVEDILKKELGFN